MIDSALYTANIASGTSVSVGDIIPLALHTGSATVRQGYGQPVLKKITTGSVSHQATGKPIFEYFVQNSNWIDPMINGSNVLWSSSALVDTSTGIQSGQDCPLEPNSTWQIYAKCIVAGAYTDAGDSLVALIDIDYPSVAAITNPATETGTPCSLARNQNVTLVGVGSTPAFTYESVDDFKPAFRYLKTKVSVTTPTSGDVGFIATRNGASMSGLCEIVPWCSSSTFQSMPMPYSVVETKGSRDIGLMGWATGTGATVSAHVITDYVKKAN